MSRKTHFVALALIILTGCSSTQVTDTWKNPQAAPLMMHKVLALVVTQDPMLKRTGEDELARRISAHPGVASLPGYAVIPEADARDREKARAAVQQAGFDGAIILRLAQVSSQPAYVPGAYPGSYYTMWGYYGYAYPLAYSPGYYTSDTVYVFEANVYSVQDDKLLFSARSQTFNPDSARALVGSVADALVKTLTKEGYLPPTQ